MKFRSKNTTNVNFNVSLDASNVRNVSLEIHETDINKTLWRYQKQRFFIVMSVMSVLKIYTLRVETEMGFTHTHICTYIGYIFQKLTLLTLTFKNLIIDILKAVFRCQFPLFVTDKCQFETDIGLLNKCN